VCQCGSVTIAASIAERTTVKPVSRENKSARSQVTGRTSVSPKQERLTPRLPMYSRVRGEGNS
jgi:hypothetical protein